VVNILAYYDTATTKAVISYKVQAPGQILFAYMSFGKCHFFHVQFEFNQIYISSNLYEVQNKMSLVHMPLGQKVFIDMFKRIFGMLIKGPFGSKFDFFKNKHILLGKMSFTQVSLGQKFFIGMFKMFFGMFFKGSFGSKFDFKK
jgi:hypothetical protein